MRVLDRELEYIFPSRCSYSYTTVTTSRVSVKINGGPATSYVRPRLQSISQSDVIVRVPPPAPLSISVATPAHRLKRRDSKPGRGRTRTREGVAARRAGDVVTNDIVSIAPAAAAAATTLAQIPQAELLLPCLRTTGAGPGTAAVVEDQAE